jgi:hypothetical protein
MDDRNYPIGYGTPPKETQFQQGKSGNPKGRPSGRKNLATIARAAFDEVITVVENGKPRTMTKGEACVALMVNSGLKGEPRAAREAIALIRYVEQCEQSKTGSALPSEKDAEILANLKRRIQKIRSPANEN